MVHPHRVKFVFEKFEKWTATIGGFQRPPCLHGGMVIGEEQGQARFWAANRKRHQLSALRTGDDHPILKRLFLIGRT
jgi:hypothetical protein